MNPTRRGFLRSIGAWFLASSVVSYFPLRLFAKTDISQEGIEIDKGFWVFNSKTQRNMQVLAETLVPWAKDIQIRKLFMERMKDDHGLAGFLDAGLWNLQANSINMLQKPFYELEDHEEKKQVIDHIIARNYQFYSRFRSTIIQIVFSDPVTWKKIAYSGPPQPRGFMDYFMPPKNL